MKKMKYLLIIVLLIPVLVNADMGAPIIPEYKAIVNNPNGITIDGKQIAYGKEVTVTWEEYFDNKTICYIGEYNGETSCSNLVPADKEFNLANALKVGRVVKLDKKHEVIILNPQGLEVYSGPSSIYEKTNNKLSYNTKYYVEYISGGDSAASSTYINDSIWLYIESKGWVFALNKNIGYKYSKEYLVPLNVTVTDYNGNEKYKVPANTKVKALYETDAWSREYLIDYKNEQGYISYDKLAYNSKGNIILKTDKKLLKDANSENKNVLEQIDKGTKLEFTYTYGEYDESWFYVTTSTSNKGWVYYNFGAENPEDVEINYYDEPKEEVDPDENTPEENETLPDDSSNKLGVEQNLVIYILVAVVVVLTAIVIMLLINKKSNEKIDTK